jgi:hypothetical protein
VAGHLEGMGIRPRFMDKIEGAGITLPPEMFAPVHEGRRR